MRPLLASTVVLLLAPLALAGCGYEGCPAGKAGKLNVHLVPHSHDDVGWLKTVDQYYYGSNRGGWEGWEENQRAGVQYIIDTAIQELVFDSQKKFIQVETAFFWRWWRQQEPEMKETVADLVKNGQLEFIGGGWSMNDEGATHYAAIIDQMTLGLRKLNDTFGECGVPRVAWQIDPFGHSKEQASLFAGMGFDGLFFGRLDWRDKEKRERTKSMEMVWEASQDMGDSSDLFTGVLYNYYSPPPGFCWDLICNDEPMMDNRFLPNNNVENRTKEFLAYVRKQANSFQTDHIVLTMGMDFNYQAAHSWFINMDKLIKHINQLQETEGSDVNIFYSTPSCYLKALYDANIPWPTKTDDFFPYASDPHAYWSGYFTSRPTSKYMIRKTEQLAKAVTRKAAMVGIIEENQAKVDWMKEAVAIVQHHDAATGTEKQHVANDYHKRLHKATIKGFDALRIKTEYDTLEDKPTYCPLTNISQCLSSENFGASSPVNRVGIFNPMAKERSHYVRLPVQSGQYEILDATDQIVVSQLVAIPQSVLDIPGRNSKATHELVFNCQIPPLGLKDYQVVWLGQDQGLHSKPYVNSSSVVTLGQGRLSLSFDVKRGKITELIDNVAKTKTEFSQEMMYYKGHRGNNSEFDFRASGAYIFRPDGNDAIGFGEPSHVAMYLGEVLDEVQMSWGWVSQVTRMHHKEQYVEVEWLVGPIPVDDGGKEVIIRYDTGLDNQGVFYTDSNGRQMMKRIRNFRPTYEINMTEPVAQNYYAVNSAAYIKEEVVGGARMTVLTDRSQGGGSILDGTLELMVHRRLLDDDAFGVGEALNEKAFGVGLVARGKHVILYNEDEEEAARQHRTIAAEMFYRPIEILNLDNNDEILSEVSSLPDNVHVLTLEKVMVEADPDGEYLLLRLEHLFEATEHTLLSLPATVDVKSLLPWCTIASIQETNLAASMWVGERDRLVFDKETNRIPTLGWEQQNHHKWTPSQLDDPFMVELRAMQIRTFLLKIMR